MLRCVGVIHFDTDRDSDTLYNQYTAGVSFHSMHPTFVLPIPTPSVLEIVVSCCAVMYGFAHRQKGTEMSHREGMRRTEKHRADNRHQRTWRAIKGRSLI